VEPVALTLGVDVHDGGPAGRAEEGLREAVDVAERVGSHEHDHLSLALLAVSGG
jgi:hypothetical protein